MHPIQRILLLLGMTGLIMLGMLAFTPGALAPDQTVPQLLRYFATYLAGMIVRDLYGFTKKRVQENKASPVLKGLKTLTMFSLTFLIGFTAGYLVF